MRPILFGAICLALSLPAHAQGPMRQYPIVCDLLVNDYRVSWPPQILSKAECIAMAKNLTKHDKTKAKIVCSCERGDRT